MRIGPWAHAQQAAIGEPLGRITHIAVTLLYTCSVVAVLYYGALSSLGFAALCLTGLAVTAALDYNQDKVAMLYHDIISGMPQTLYAEGVKWPPIKIRDNGTCFFRALALAYTYQSAYGRLKGLEDEQNIADQTSIDTSERLIRKAIAKWVQENVKPDTIEFETLKACTNVQNPDVNAHAKAIEDGDKAVWGSELEAKAAAKALDIQVWIGSKDLPLQKFGDAGYRIVLYHTSTVQGSSGKRNHYELLLNK